MIQQNIIKSRVSKYCLSQCNLKGSRFSKKGPSHWSNENNANRQVKGSHQQPFFRASKKAPIQCIDTKQIPEVLELFCTYDLAQYK